MRILLIHDTRSVAFLTAVVLFRLHVRRGDIVTLLFGIDTTKHATDFWGRTVDELPLADIDQVIFCCITFDDTQEEACLFKLRKIEDFIGKPPMILSHRWPDGYAKTPYPVVIPPLRPHGAVLSRSPARGTRTPADLADYLSPGRPSVGLGRGFRLLRVPWDGDMGFNRKLLGKVNSRP